MDYGLRPNPPYIDVFTGCYVIGKILFLICLLFSSLAHALEVIDDTAQTVSLKAPAQRIISLAPDLTELLFAAGAGAKIIGVAEGCNYPAAAKKIPVIANYHVINPEVLLALHPDLIIVWKDSNAARRLTVLQRLGIPIFVSQQRDLKDIPITLRKLGHLAGTDKIANQAAENFSERLASLQKKYSRQKTLSVFYQVWPHPLITINHDSWINQIITLCGGKNIFANLKMTAPVVGIEGVVAANPDVIISNGQLAELEKIWRPWRQVRAVQSNRLYVINPDLVERAGPRLIEGAEKLCRLLS